MIFVYFFIVLYFGYGTSFFIRYPFGPKFFIKDKEVNKKIEYKLPPEKQEIINKINGLYAMIGPDINIKEVSNLFDLFIGDGIIQGVFFDNGNLTYAKQYVRTEKIVYEEKNGRIPRNSLSNILFMFLNKIGLFPNVLGMANTALLNIKNKIYALYERDSPYLLNIDFKKSEIQTIRKMYLNKMKYFSAHSKYNNTIDTFEYNMLTNSIIYHEMTSDFESIKTKVIKMNYLPVVHDFLKTKNNIIITDSPLVMDFSNLFKKKMPVMLDNKKKTIINVLNKSTMNIDKYYVNEGFYIFHYADYKENDKHIEIYASLYDNLDFSDLNIVGKYRKIILDKETKTVVIIKNSKLEKLDLDFPVKYANKVAFRSMENNRINGFVICEELEIVKTLYFENKFITGEPAITTINNVPYLFSFAFDNEKSDVGFLIIINMNSYDIIEIPINEFIQIGFHSTFISNL
jgi:carotenoid cleavage dioxygenase-like enzyme